MDEEKMTERRRVKALSGKPTWRCGLQRHPCPRSLPAAQGASGDLQIDEAQGMGHGTWVTRHGLLVGL